MILGDFFQIGTLPTDQIIGSYNLWFVALSYVVATFASFIALDLTGRLRDVSNTKLTNVLWLCGGAFAMGAGIWSMHFIGMLAFNMNGMPMMLDTGWTIASLIVAIFASGFALFLLKTKVINVPHLVLGGIILGFAIASMHYVGMQAMQTMVHIHYLPSLFVLSIIIAIAASEAALYFALKSNQVVPSMRFQLKFISAFIMGAAICGMHYTGMAAAVFTPSTSMTMHDKIIDPAILAMSIAGATFLILGIAVLVSSHKEAYNQKMLAIAHQAGMAEVAASVLHNVGNVLNSVNVSAGIIAEKITKSKLSELSLLETLIAEHKNDLGTFITSDPKGSQLPTYIKMLSQYWENEKSVLQNELNNLITNIQHIKDIIAMQQNLSKVKKINEVVAIDKTLEEAIVITGVDQSDIVVEKNYKTLKPVLIDKVKLLQILVNLIHNSKEALKETNDHKKIITIKMDKEGDRFFIIVADNGMGISHKNLTYIFSYGFTTKNEGHGFGLHSCALAAKEMGGTISADSNGIGQGAQFKVEFPYQLPNK